jgi:hypothetical protein
MPALGSASQASHLRRGAGLVDEDQVLGIEIRLGVEPSLPPRGDVGPLLLARVRRFFSR